MHPGAQVVKEATLQHCNVASCNRTYREISKAAACKSVCKPVATPKVSKGRSESPLVASAEAKPCETEKARRPFSLPSTRNPFLVENPIRLKRWAPKVSKGRAESPLVASAEAKPCETEKARRPFSLPSTRNPFLVENPICIKRWAPKVSKGRSESPLVASAEAKPCETEKARRPFSLPSTRNPFLVENPIRIKRWAPKVSKGRAESPLVASAEAKSSAKQKRARNPFSLAIHKKSISCRKPYPHQEVGPEGFQRAIGKPFGRLRRGEILCETEKARRLFSLLSTRNLFLVRGFARLRADEVLSPRGKVPKGRRGRPKGACLMAAPGPPVAKLQCTASLAGARPARFTSVPGRATVAFGAADPSPGSWAPVYPWSDGKGPLRQEHLAAIRAAH